MIVNLLKPGDSLLWELLKMSLVHRVFDKIERADQCDYHDYYHNIMRTKFSEKAKERNGEEFFPFQKSRHLCIVI